jgi:glycosyltransferase involved in cell wall biosynthesis
MEAMMSPCLIIGSNIRGIRDLIVDNKGGYLFNPRKIEDLINVINKAINEQNVWSLMKRENFAEIRKFSKSYIVDEIKTIYQNLGQ